MNENPNTADTAARLPDLRVGHIVVFLAGDDRVHNGTVEHPAIVTRVWGKGPRPTVNLKVLPDCGEPFDATSVQHWSIKGYWPIQYAYREV